MNAMTPFDMTGYANDPAKLDACNGWVAACRPIIETYLKLDDEAVASLVTACAKEREGKRWNEPRTPMEREYREARDYCDNAAKSIYAMLEGIRDSFICDERVGLQDDDTAQDAADEFNDWLAEQTITVDAAIKQVSDDVYAAWLASIRSKAA